MSNSGSPQSPPVANAEQVAKAVHTVLQSRLDNERRAAEAYLNRFRDSSEGWKYCVQLFQKTLDADVLFWCLHVFETIIDRRYDSINNDDIQTLINVLMCFIRDVCSTKDLPMHVKKKLAQIIVQIMKRRYPEKWRSFFSDFLTIMQSKQTHATAQMFFGILKELNWSIVDSHELTNKAEMDRNTMIKDAMRENDLKRIVEVWYSFCQMYEKQPSLTQICLETMDKYICWIDIDLIANQRFLTLLYKFLSISSLQIDATDCLYEIVNKRMYSDKKLEMLTSINILQIASQSQSHKQSDEFALKMGGLLDCIGRQLIGCVRDNYDNAEPMVLDCYDSCLPYFQHNNYEVSQEVCPFFHDFWLRIQRRNDKNKRNRNPNSPSQIQYAQRERQLFQKSLECISRKLCYPPGYDIGEPDEFEWSFDKYREDLDKILKTLTRVAPNDILDLITNHFSTVCSKLQNNSNSGDTPLQWTVIESDLHLIYRICEDFNPGVPSDDIVRSSPGFLTLYGMVVQSRITTLFSQQPKILIKYFDLAVRYWPYLESNPQYIGEVLHTFVDQRGLKSPNSTVRGRATYCLCKLIKNLCSNSKLAKTMTQFSDAIIGSLSGVLKLFISNRDKCPFDADEANNIVQTLGILCSIEDEQKCREHAGMIANFFLSALRYYITNRTEWMHGNPVLAGRNMSEYIGCLQSFSKAFNSSNRFVMPIISECTDVVLQACNCIPKDEQLRNEAICFLHRSQILLRTDIVRHLNKAFHIFINFLTELNVVRTLQIFGQIVANMSNDEQFLKVFNEFFWPLLTRVYQLINKVGPIDPTKVEHSQDFAMRLDILKHYYMFLSRTIQAQCFEIFFSQSNRPHLEQIIASLLDGCIPSKNNNASVNKQCFIIFNDFITGLYDDSSGKGGDTDTDTISKKKEIRQNSGIENIFLIKLVENIFAVPMSQPFNPNNPEYHRLWKIHIIGLQKTFFKCFGNVKAGNAIGGYLCSKLGVSQSDAELYCSSLLKNDSTKCTQFIFQLRANRMTNNGNRS